MTKKCKCGKYYRSKRDMCTSCLSKMIYNQFNGVEEKTEPEKPKVNTEVEQDVSYKFEAKGNDNIIEAVRCADELGVSYGEYIAMRRTGYGLFGNQKGFARADRHN